MYDSTHSNLHRSNQYIWKLLILVFAATVAGLVLAHILEAPVYSQENDFLSQLCTVQSAEINENSGIALSNLYEDTLWTHNDSGADAATYLISQKTGKTIAKLSLKGAKNIDWEDISTFKSEDTHFILIADVGDNRRKRTSCLLHLVEEPALDSIDHEIDSPHELSSRDFQTIRFQYEDGPHDCEAVAVDIQNRKVILIEKVFSTDDRTPGVFVMDLPEEINDELLTAKRIKNIRTKNITGMAISSDGLKLVVRTYVDGFLFTRDQEQTWEQAFQSLRPKPLALPMQRQGEGICFSSDGKAVICSSEFRKAPLWLVQLKDQP